MHVKQILTRCFPAVFAAMHKTRQPVLLQAVEALVTGHRLTLIDIARAWPAAEFVHAPLKALDRLLSNRHMSAHRLAIQQRMAQWLLRGPHPLVLVDWADLKSDNRWYLLRASVPVGGRSMTLLDQLYPMAEQNTPKAQQHFLQLLKTLVGDSKSLIVISDAGFRSDWCRAVQAMGWHFVGRLRNNTKLRQHGHEVWAPCHHLHPLAKQRAKDLGDYQMVQSKPLSVRLVMIKQASRQRHGLNANGTSQLKTQAKRARKAAQEPWFTYLLADIARLGIPGGANVCTSHAD